MTQIKCCKASMKALFQVVNITSYGWTGKGLAIPAS